MIRKRVGDEFWLITQHDHALLSGQLAQRLGNSAFDAPTAPAGMLAISHHDGGWPIHDDAPTLSAEKLPLDVFESPRALALEVWQASAERAAAQDDYAGLLVSLHGLSLCAFAIDPTRRGAWDLTDGRARFEVNRFQHNMIELGESLRQRLGLRTDRPLRLGLSTDTHDLREQRLAFDFWWLEAMDAMSLNLCCTAPRFPHLDHVIARPGSISGALRVEMISLNAFSVAPWPFAPPTFELSIPFRRITVVPFETDEQFRNVYQQATTEYFTVCMQST